MSANGLQMKGPESKLLISQESRDFNDGGRRAKKTLTPRRAKHTCQPELQKNANTSVPLELAFGESNRFFLFPLTPETSPCSRPL